MSDELKPCPFCGEDETTYFGLSHLTGQIFCESCGCEGPWSPAFDGDWNTRAVDPAAIRKAALQEAADVVREFGNAMSRIGLHPDADSLRCDAASVALIGASSAILALIEKDASDETA